MLKIFLRYAGHLVAFLHRMSVAIFLLLALALAGLILTLRYSVLPEIQQHHADISRTVSEALGMDVEIGEIAADWHGIGPHLRLADIRLLNAQKNTVMVLQKVDVVLSWMTLFSGELRLASLEIDQPDLLVKRDAKGELQISGVPLGGESTDNAIANMLLKQSRIVVRNARITWHDEQKGKSPLIFEQVNLLLENRWNTHRFAVRATPPAHLSTQIDVRGKFYGRNFDDIQSWSGEIFTQLDYANLAAWKNWLPLPDALKQGRGALRGWLGVDDGKISQLSADLALVNVQTRLAADLPPLDIRVLSGRVGWRAVSLGNEFTTHNLSLKLYDNFVLKPTDVYLRLSGTGDNEVSSGELNANLLELEGLGKLMDYLPLERKWKTRFVEFSPQGTVEKLQAKWQVGKNSKMHYKVAGRFSELALKRVGDMPGFSGLSGEVDGSEGSGFLSVNSRNLKVDAPGYMPQSIQLDSFSAQSSWQSNGAELEFKLRNLIVANTDLAGTAYGSFQTMAKSPGKIDLTVHLSRASVMNAGMYIPLIALDKEVQTWLGKALQDGQANDFNLRMKGDLKDFPFVDNRRGIFRVQARAKGVALEYDKDWPRISNASAELLIQGKELQVNASTAMTAGVSLKNVKVSIPDMLSEVTLLNIDGEAEADHARALAYVHVSPVRGYLEGFTDDIVASGNGRLKLKLNIPLSGPQPVKVEGLYHFTDSEVEFYKFLPTLRKVNGDLLFTESTVSTQNIVAQIMGGPAKVTVVTNEAGAINVKLSGRSNFNALRDSHPRPVLTGLNGGSPWDVEISVLNKLLKVSANSNLAGIYSELPAPFAKHADESIPVHFEMKDLNPDQTMVSIQYGNLFNANLLRVRDDENSWSNQKGMVNFGNVVQKAERDGLWVIGTLPHLALEGWGGIAEELQGGEGEPIEIAGVDLQIQKLSGYGNSINDLHISAASRNNILIAQLASRELNGEVSWQSDDSGKLVVRLKNLDLDMAETEVGRAEPVKSNSQTARSNAAELPIMDVKIDRLSFKGKPIGRLDLLARQVEEDYLLEQMHLSNPDGVLSVDGKWTRSTVAPLTQFNLKYDISNAGSVLNRAGYPNSLKNGNGKLEGSFSWFGEPRMYESATLNGKLSLDMNKGQFLQIDPGIGKLLSILSLQALPKRITLDFEDVFSKGFEFDSIKGSAEINQGVILTDNLKIDGSSAKVSMKGKIDLAHETQELQVRIVPAVGNSVALISALVATPVVGAGVYLAGKLLDDPLGQLASFEYRVSGSWVDPKVEKMGSGKAAK